MKTENITVYLNEYVKVDNFCKDMSTLESEIDIVRGRYVIDAKSIMGIFSLDLSKPVEVTIHAANDAELVRFKELVKKYV